VGHFFQRRHQLLRADNPKHIEPAQRIQRHQPLRGCGRDRDAAGHNVSGGKNAITHGVIVTQKTRRFNAKIPIPPSWKKTKVVDNGRDPMLRSFRQRCFSQSL
jgi:hypothetical protein